MKSKLIISSLLFSLFLFAMTACQTGDVTISDPKGTVMATFGVDSEHARLLIGEYAITFDEEAARMDGSASGVQFATCGKVDGLGYIASMPTRSWEQSIAAVPHYGYILRLGEQGQGGYARLYVVNFVEDEHYNIIGLQVKYDYPWTPSSGAEEADLVDLGLPSGTLWHKTNEEGETGYFTPYEFYSLYESNEIPTAEDWYELLTCCTWTWSENGYTVKGPNGQSIYLPAAGVRSNGQVSYENEYGIYLFSKISDTPQGMYFSKEGVSVTGLNSDMEYSLRLVYHIATPVTPPDPEEQLVLSETQKEIRQNQQFILTANMPITDWSVSLTDILIIDRNDESSLRVYGERGGEVVITVYSGNQSAQCTVTVRYDEPYYPGQDEEKDKEAWQTLNPTIYYEIQNGNQLHIWGSGSMQNPTAIDSPWRRYADQLTSVVVDYGIENICHHAFKDLQKIESVALPPTIQEIGDHAFERCYQLTEIILPEAMTRIEHSAFADCTKCMTVVCKATTPPNIGYDAFCSTQYNSGTLYVPWNAIDAYRQTDEWNRFQNIQSY